MSNSPLICHTKLSPNCNKPRNHAIDTITIHCMAGDMNVENCGSWFAQSTTQASSNYGIGSDGRIGMYVEEANRSWCTSSGANDHRAITIEVASAAVAPYAVSGKALAALIELCADICKRNGIKRLLWQGDKNLLGQTDKQNMSVHRWFANKSCPGDYLYGKHPYIADEVNKRLGAVTPPPAPAPSTAANDETIWKYLTGKGLNAYAVAGLMGNLYAESGFIPNNLQNSFEKTLGYTDESYTTAVDSGKYSGFVKDGAGYGLAQWTYYSRKQALLDFAQAAGASIGDLTMQLNFLWKELQGFSGVMSVLNSAKTVAEASNAVLLQFERPADQSEAAQSKRAGFGQTIYAKFGTAANDAKPETSVKTLEEITVENALVDGIISDRAHWLGVLNGTIKPVPEYIKKVMDNAHAAIAKR